jgi:hypothetical protein
MTALWVRPIPVGIITAAQRADINRECAQRLRFAGLLIKPAKLARKAHQQGRPEGAISISTRVSHGRHDAVGVQG